MPFPILPTGCPPSDARPCIGDVYRLVASATIASSDFISHFNLYPEKSFANECEARGLSVYLTYQAARKLRKRYKAYRTHLVAVASFSGATGQVKLTGTEHHTWWPDQDFEPESFFAIDPAEIR